MSKDQVKQSLIYHEQETSEWHDQLQELNINEIEKERRVELIIFVESLPKHFDDIEKFQKYAYVYTSFDVKPIIYEEIIYIIKHYPAWSRSYISSDLENMFGKACTEAGQYLKSKKPIPLELMAELIKLRAILLIKEDIYNEKMIAMKILGQTMPTELSDSCETSSNFSDEDENAAKENELINKESYTVVSKEKNEISSTLYDDAYVSENDTVDVFFNSCSLILQEYARIQRKKSEKERKRVGIGSKEFIPNVTEKEMIIRKPSKTRPPWSIRHCKWRKQKESNPPLSLAEDILENSQSKQSKLLYIVLTGFYDPYLVLCLINSGLPVTCILSVGTKDDKLIDPTLPFYINTAPLTSTAGFVPVYNYSLQRLYTQSAKPIKICDLNYDNMKEHLIYHFWNTMEDLFVSNHDHLKDIIYIICPPVDIKGKYVKYNSKEYKKQSADIFRNVAELLYKLPSFRKYHVEYTNDLKIIDLGETPEYIAVHEMFYYNEILNKLPPECYTIGLTLEALLEEVHQKNIKDNQEQQEKQPSKTKKYSKTKVLCHKLFNKYKFTYMPCNFAIFYNKHQPMLSLSRKTKHKPKRFEIYDDDNLQLKTIYYPKFAEKLRSRILCDMKQSVPLRLWKLYNTNSVDSKLNFNTNQYQTWASLLRLSPEDTTERLYAHMFKLLKCAKASKDPIPRIEFHKYFPEPKGEEPIILTEYQEKCETIYSDFKQNIYEQYDESNFQWQENLNTNVLLRKLDACQNSFRCMDHNYIPVLDSIILRFHNNCNEFGIATKYWKESLRSPIGLHDFFKSVIYEDIAWVLLYEKLYKRSDENERNYTATVDFISSSSVQDKEKFFAEISDLYVTPNKDKQLLNFMKTILIKSLQSFLGKPFIGYNLNCRSEVSGISTIFHSLDGLKIRMENTFLFNIKPHITLEVEADHHTLFLHVQPSKKFSFHFEASNGARLAFSKYEPSQVIRSSKILTAKKPSSKQRRCYSIKEIETIGFSKRVTLHKMHILNENSLLRILNELRPMNSFSSTQTLQFLESKKSILFKSTTSLVNIKCRNTIPKMYFQVMKAIKKIKRENIPHFRIVSSALHKCKYVKVAKLKIPIQFINGIKILRYIPNLDIKQKIEISKCVHLQQKKQVESVYSPCEAAETVKEVTYVTKLSLPNGLQVATEPSLKPGTTHIIQYYISNSPNLSDEISRTFIRNGYVQIRYRNGSIKMIGVHGKCIIGELPCHGNVLKKNRRRKIKKSEIVKSSEDSAIKKFVNLQKSIHRKIYRYQLKFIHSPTKKYLKRKWEKKSINSNDLKKLANNIIRKNVNLTENNLLSAINFHIPEDSLNDHFTLDTATTDSHSFINDDGELITIYTDGTRITSWFKIDKEMIVIEDDEDEDKGAIEVDHDDYLCNFLIPRVGGWISVQVFYQFEHPQYATVVYCRNNETHIRLPDKIEYQERSDGSFFINLKDEIYAYINTENINLSTNYCKNCYDYCKTTINVKDLFNNEPNVQESEILLEARDSFHKVFKVAYNGVCYRNVDFNPGIVKHDCQAHKIDDTQKFFVFDKNLNGKMYWNDNKVQEKIINAENNSELSVKLYLDEKDNLKVCDIFKYYYNHYPDRFLMKYYHPNPPIFRYHLDNIFPNVVYTTKRQISVVPDCSRVLPLFTVIQDLRAKNSCVLPLPNFENIFQLEQYLNTKPSQIKSNSTDTINMKLSPVFAEATVENFTKLMKKVNKFKINSMGDLHFEKTEVRDESTGSTIHECSETCFTRHSPGTQIHPKLLYHKILYHKIKKDREGIKTKCKKARLSYKQSKDHKIPPVPKNSVISTAIVHTFKETQEEETISLSDFIKKTNKGLLCEPVKKRHTQYCKRKHKNLSQIGMPLLTDLTDWKKPMYLIKSDSSVKLPTTNVTKNANLKTRDKQVSTSTPFDLFLDNDRLTEDENNQRIISSELPVSQLKYPSSEMFQPESKHSKLMSGVQAIESYNKVYDKVISLSKGIPKSMKRFTELHRNILRRINSITGEDQDNSLPLILESSDTKEGVRLSKQHTILDFQSFQMKPVKLKKKRRSLEEETLQSKILDCLAKEKLNKSLKSLKYKPSQIDKQIQMHFDKNCKQEMFQKNYNATSPTGLKVKRSSERWKNTSEFNKTTKESDRNLDVSDSKQKNQ